MCSKHPVLATLDSSLEEGKRGELCELYRHGDAHAHKTLHMTQVEFTRLSAKENALSVSYETSNVLLIHHTMASPFFVLL